MSSTTYLYWLRLPEHTDPLSEGYIGITKDAEIRQRAHFLSNGSFYQLRDTAVFDVLNEYPTREEAGAAEFEMRPAAYIGWNRAPGGVGTTYFGLSAVPENFPDFRNPKHKPRKPKPKKTAAPRREYSKVPHRLFNFRVDCDIADQFKQICQGNDVSMARMLKQYMQQEVGEHISYKEEAPTRELIQQTVTDGIFI